MAGDDETRTTANDAPQAEGPSENTDKGPAVHSNRPPAPKLSDIKRTKKTASKNGKVRHTLRYRWDAISLSTKIVAALLVLLTIGVAGISFSIRQLVSNYLLEKIDTQIIQQAQLVVNNISLLSETDSSDTSAGMTDYYLQIRDTEAHIISTPLKPVLSGGVVSEPVLPADGSMDDITFGEPFTTEARVFLGDSSASRSTLSAARSPWRVVAMRVVNSDGEFTNIAFIGLSLSDQIDTVSMLTRYCIMVGAAIILLGGVIGMLVVQGTLAPLKRIEKTAAKIAAGDLKQRVPAAPENTEIGSLSASLNAMLARIEKSFREQQDTTEQMKRFVSDASHELRTPLAAIHGYAELYKIQRDTPGALERADESIAHIEASSARMTVLVEDLLSLARLDEGRGIDITQKVNLTPIITDAADDLHALDPERGVTCGVATLDASQSGSVKLAFQEGDMPHVTFDGDPSRLRQVATNVVGNIHRYTPSDSPVEVGVGTLTASLDTHTLSHMPPNEQSLNSFLETVEVDQPISAGVNYAIFQFIDHGPGVPDDSRSRIFDRFYTADPSRAREKGGTGLGMAIVQSVVKAHHGFICASESSGGGLTITVVLPIGPAEQPDSGTAGANKPAKSTKSSAVSKNIKLGKTDRRTYKTKN